MAPDVLSTLALLAAQSEVSVGLLAFLGVVVTAAGAFFIARKTHSGRIQDSEAAKLWDESTKMRLELREQVEALQTENRELKLELAKCRDGQVRHG